MNDSAVFWRSVVDEIGNEEFPVDLDPSSIGADTPDWVTKLAVEVITMLMPRIQLRIGDNATPENVGAVMGNVLAMTEAISGVAVSPGFIALLEQAKSFLNGFDATLAIQELPKVDVKRRRAMAGAIEKILERPADERFRFFRAFTRGIQPEKMDDRATTLTSSDMKKLNTLTVYGAALMNWQRLDERQTSKQAYDFLVALLSVDVVGHDSERVRRMFSRLGKQFSRPGRPAGR